MNELLQVAKMEAKVDCNLSLPSTNQSDFHFLFLGIPIEIESKLDTIESVDWGLLKSISTNYRYKSTPDETIVGTRQQTA